MLGAVKRPGVYELLPDEQIQDLINVLGDGYTEDANKDDILLKRFVGGKEVWEKKHLKEADVIADIPLFDKDSVSVWQYSIARNVFYVEGSIVGLKTQELDDMEGTKETRFDGTAYDPVSFNRMRIEYTVGLNWFIRGQALKVILNYVFCNNQNRQDSHKIILATQIMI